MVFVAMVLVLMVAEVVASSDNMDNNNDKGCSSNNDIYSGDSNDHNGHNTDSGSAMTVDIIMSLIGYIRNSCENVRIPSEFSILNVSSRPKVWSVL